MEEKDKKDEWSGFWSLIKFGSIRKNDIVSREDNIRWIYEDEEISFSKLEIEKKDWKENSKMIRLGNNFENFKIW